MLNLPFEGGSNSSYTKDYSINANNGTVNDVAPAGSFGGSGIGGQAWVTDAQGVWAGNVSDTIGVGGSNVQLIGDDTFSLTGWFKVTELNAGAGTGTANVHFFDTDRGGLNPAGYRVSIIAGQGGQTPAMTFVSNSASASTITPVTGGYALDVWYFMAAVADGASGSTLWLARADSNWASRQEDTNAAAIVAPGAGSASLLLGRDSATPPGAFDGMRDDFAIWNRALTAAEAQQIFEAGQQGQDLGVVIPEPATMALLGIGGLMVLRRRRSA